MSASPRPQRLGAAELTLKFRRHTEELAVASSARSQWVKLVPQRSHPVQRIPNAPTSSLEVFHSETAAKNVGLKNSPEKKMVLKELVKNSADSSDVLSGFNVDSFVKLHALCSSPTLSIEMIRM
jgi:hypothetical protein